MGWGLDKSKRQQVLKDCYIKDPYKIHKAVVIDMNAKIRQKAVDAASMWTVVRNIFKEALKVKPQCITCIFDAPMLMPAIRSLLWQKRYGSSKTPENPKALKTAAEFAKAAKQASAAAKMVEGKPPYAHMFHPSVKPHTWAAFENIVKRIAAATMPASGVERITIINQHNIETTIQQDYNITQNQCPLRYGEADLKAYAIAKQHAAKHESVIIMSVDTDLILQTIATVGTAPSAFCPTTPMTIKLKDETIDAAKVINMFGNKDPHKRLNAAFWLIMGGGTDYTRPASDQGYNKLALIDAAHPSNLGESSFSQHTGPQNVYAVLKSLKKTRKVARTPAGKSTKTGRSIKDAVIQAAATTAYYALINPNPDPVRYR